MSYLLHDAAPHLTVTAQDAAGTRERLHPGGQVRGVTQGGILDIEIIVDRPNDDLSRVQADPDLQPKLFRLTELFTMRHISFCMANAA